MSSMSTLRRSLRTAYLAAGALSVAAATAGRRGDRLTRIVKPTLMPLLAATVVAGGANNAARSGVPGSPTSSRVAHAARSQNPRNATESAGSLGSSGTTAGHKSLLVAGLAGGWLGDIILMGKNGRSADAGTRARHLNRGSSAFALNQVAYIATLWRQGHRPHKNTVALKVPVLLSGIATAAMGAPKALPAATGYGSLLAATSILAADEGETTPLGIGGNLFVLSDGLILARQAFLTGERPLIRALDGVVDGLVMATYVAAQLLLVDGLSGEHQR